MSAMPARAMRSVSSTSETVSARPVVNGAKSAARLDLVPPANCPPDQGIASYFIWLRRHTGLSIHQTAALLHTEAEVIAALEAGAICELPVWPETSRVVAAYAAIARVDPTPALEALYSRWNAAQARRKPR